MYKEYFGFRDLPFSDLPNPELFYSNPVFEEALASLHHGVHAKNGIIVVTGDNGTGKTTLMRKFLHDMGSSLRPIHVVRTALPLFSMLRAALNNLGAAHQSTDELETVETFKNYVRRNARDGATTCLIFDEADCMINESFEELKRLLQITETQSSLPQIFLIGEPELMNKLDRPEQRQLKQRVGLHCRLVPLIKSEVGRYIEFHIRSAGYEGARLFDLSAVEAVAHYSEGIPRLVNKICDNALLAACRHSRKEVLRDLVDEVARDLHMVGHEQARQVAAMDNNGGIHGGTSSPDWQIESVWSNLRINDEPEPPPLIAPQPRGKFNIKIVGLLGVLVVLGLAGGIMHFGTAKSYIEFSKGSVETSKASVGDQGLSADGEMAKRLSLQNAPSGNRNPAALDGDHDDMGAVSKREILSSVKISEPISGTSVEKIDAGTSPQISSQKVRVPQGMSNTERRLLEIKIYKAIRNRAIEGVSVTLVKHIAILSGQVASVRQKAMAERAALGVREVARVKNQIRIRR